MEVRMKHLIALSKVPGRAATGTSTLEIKLDGIIQILDRLALAQRQAAWKAPFPIGGSTNTTTTTNTGGGGTLPTV
jgi:hypothetical protein